MEEECKLEEQVLPSPAIIHDVEEGEISDSTSSVEEITKEDFNQPDQPALSGATPDIQAADPLPKAIVGNPENNSISASNNPSNNSKLNYNNNNNCSNNSSNTNGNSSSQQNRVWTMRDLYEYQYSRNYSRGGHNLAWASWASAVKNQPFPKPLDDVIIMDVSKSTADDASLKPDDASADDASLKPDDASLKPAGSPESSPSSTGGENEAAKVVVEIDDDKIEGLDEKEDGELEEGEIDLESDVVNYDGGQFKSIDAKVAELESRANSILKGLENFEGEYAEKSFNDVYSMVENLLESLGEFTDDISFTKKDDIIQLILTAFQSLKTVFASMSQIQKDQKGESLKRFIASLMTQKHPFLSSEQLREMEILVSSMSYSTMCTSSEGIQTNNEIPVVDGFTKNSVDIYLENSLSDLIDESVEPVPMEISDLSEADDTVENLGVPEVSSRYKGLSLPLLDLHKDHDADSLPSPTREVPSNLPVDRTIGFGRGMLKPEWPIPRVSIETGLISLHPYETEAVKAVSTYQQKFGRSSFLMTDRLPSPTPSEDGDAADGDISGEVSSSLRNVNPVSVSAGEQQVSSVTPKRGDLSGQVFSSAWSSAPVSVGQNHQAKPSLTRSRDPRLRLINSDDTCDSLSRSEPKTEPAWGSLGSRKHKTVGEPLVGRPALKRSRNEPIESQVVHNGQTMSGAGLWLDSGGTVGMQMAPRNQEFVNGPAKPGNTLGLVSSSSIAPNLMVNMSDNVPSVVPGTTTSLQSLLKEIAVNPSIWMNILKMEQKKSVAPTISTPHHPSLNSVLGSVPLMHSVSPKPSIVMPRSSGPPQVQTVASPVEESGVMRMKPRDPRRVLHNTPQNGGSVGGHSLSKTATLSGPGRGSSLVEQRHEDQVDKKSVPTTSGPDITRQFTKNLKNIADLVSVTQSTSLQSSIPQTAASEPAQAIQGRLDKRAASDINQAVAGLASKEASAVSSQPQNNWGDVEHLFDGFDDQEKAALHRERARRMEEQQKMFAARKLCLVLDLDHTLLNSAKFVEVDPVHNEILRKKEEEDRGKPQRQLFRFPHMSMWTKLRPGIWNFLDKASKLFELHLYTMGNKLYATEMAKLLDPKGELFAGRVISRGDDGDPFDGDERVPKSKDLEGVLGMESAVVIIDDSVRVWPHNRLNLIVVERYIYFPCSRRQFGLSGPSLLEIDHDERQEDGTLASSLAVIEKIHFEFFQHQSLHEADVRNILASEQRKILAGCRILFSRVIPVGEAKPHLHPLWQTAEQFGAVCTNSIDEQVTHVVANSLGTDKVNWALCTGRFVVHPGWVEASALLYRRANEHDFAIK